MIKSMKPIKSNIRWEDASTVTMVTLFKVIYRHKCMLEDIYFPNRVFQDIYFPNRVFQDICFPNRVFQD